MDRPSHGGQSTAKLGDLTAACHAKAPVQQWYDPQPRTFTRRDRATTTVIIGGLTETHDLLNQAFLEQLGYRAECLSCPDTRSLAIGKEFCSRGHCNPAYFTIGNLLKRLFHLRDVEGMSVPEIVRRYLFFNAGACGPCRFGAYTTEYRRALRDAGFEGFRVLTFQQMGGLRQDCGEADGLDFNPTFTRAFLKSLLAADVLNALGYRLRPYEVHAGQTDRLLAECRQIVAGALRDGRSVLRALRRCRKILRTLQLDWLRVKPKVAIIGEFWAMTTEGDGNYRLQQFLESEGAEVEIQLLVSWILYMVWQVRHNTRRRMLLRGADRHRLGLAGKDPGKVLMRMWFADKFLRMTFRAFAHAAGLVHYALPDMELLARLARDHYDLELRGGEGHMEVGKLIHCVTRKTAHLVVSVKPFGCLPSSGVSDGVQAAVISQYPGANFCAVETTGDSAVNFQSRVLMHLFEARRSAQAEFAAALASKGWNTEHARALAARRQGVRCYPRQVVGGTAANLVYEL